MLSNSSEKGRTATKRVSILQCCISILVAGVTGGSIGFNLAAMTSINSEKFNCVSNAPLTATLERVESCPPVAANASLCPICEPIPVRVEPHMECPICPVQDPCPSCDEKCEKTSKDTQTHQRFDEKMNRIAVGMSRVPRMNFANKFDTGVSLRENSVGNEEVLILYNHHNAQPNSREQTQHDGEVPLFDKVEEATANCDYLNIVLTDVDNSRRQCIAIIGQPESFHIQRFMRVPAKGELNASVPLRQVGRMVQANGDNLCYVPPPEKLVSHGGRIRTFLENMDSVLDALRPLAVKAAGNKGVIVVMFANFGQAEFIINFCCSALARNLDMSSLLIFATDIESKELLDGFGLNVFYEERIFGHLPKDASHIYGDYIFSTMMEGKVFCIKLAIMLGYDVLFQDADVVWYKDPLPYFRNESLAQYDVLIADDGNNIAAYLPYMGNGGFIYLRQTSVTNHLINSLFLSYVQDEQYQLIQLLAEYSSLYGMQVKVLERELFPTGVVYHLNTETMKSYIRGEVEPYMFHMSWTESKNNKLLYFQQMGDWFVEDKCIGSTANGILNSSFHEQPTLEALQQGAFVAPCCSMSPLISCHFTGKPSVIDCIGKLPPPSSTEPSFW